MKAWKLAVLVLTMAVFSSGAWADWNTGDPAKWVQMPNLANGMDVNATFNGQYPYVKTLADDFQCTQTGPITDVHLWGSWLNDRVDPNATIQLSIYADVPAGGIGTTNYSHPGTQLWQTVFTPTQYAMRPWATASEQFYDPNTNTILGTDTQVWQYNFLIPQALQFVQQGAVATPVIYWLGVQVLPTTPDMIFGWKTSLDHHFDDAVFADTQAFAGPVTGLWQDMHDFTGQSLDQAFVITTVPEPATMSLLGLGLAGLILRRKRQGK
jgi:hypothetical protein